MEHDAHLPPYPLDEYVELLGEMLADDWFRQHGETRSNDRMADDRPAKPLN